MTMLSTEKRPGRHPNCPVTSPKFLTTMTNEKQITAMCGSQKTNNRVDSELEYGWINTNYITNYFSSQSICSITLSLFFPFFSSFSSLEGLFRV